MFHTKGSFFFECRTNVQYNFENVIFRPYYAGNKWEEREYVLVQMLYFVATL